MSNRITLGGERVLEGGAIAMSPPHLRQAVVECLRELAECEALVREHMVRVGRLRLTVKVEHDFEPWTVEES